MRRGRIVTFPRNLSNKVFPSSEVLEGIRSRSVGHCKGLVASKRPIPIDVEIDRDITEAELADALLAIAIRIGIGGSGNRAGRQQSPILQLLQSQLRL